MSGLKIIEHFEKIAGRYDALLCDAWGVIHNGVELFDGVEEALVNFRRECGPVIILTNAPRPSAIIPPQLDRLGFSRNAYDGVVTSGDSTRAEIVRMGRAPAFRIGPEKDDPLFEGLDIRFAPLEEAGFIICTGMKDDQNDKPSDYQPLLATAAALNLPMVCANPDIVVRWGGKLIFCAGALAEIYEHLGGEVVYGGKPYRPIYELAHAKVEEAAGEPVDRRRILAIGDGLGTDIAGANANGFDALYVAGVGGIHIGPVDSHELEDRLKEAGAEVIGVMTDLKW